MCRRPIPKDPPLSSQHTIPRPDTGPGEAGRQQPILALTDVEKRYGATLALAGVSLALTPGRMTGLLGPNGAGKSTLIAIAAGIIAADAGLRSCAPDVRIGYMPQEHALYPQLTAAENLAFVARTAGLKGGQVREAVGRSLADVGLADRADDRAGGFSGGMKRRLGFAAAVIGRPQVLLLDEPTVGVDPQSRLALIELTRAERDAGTAILYSTHLMEEVEAHADEVAILHEGQVLDRGGVADLLHRHASTYVELETTEVDLPGLVGAVADSDDLGNPVRLTDSGEAKRVRLRIEATDPSTALRSAFRAAESCGATVTDMRLVEPTLEAVFLTLTGRGLRD